MNCPVDYEEANSQDKSTDHMMMYQNESKTSSQECVGNDQDMLPIKMTTKDRHMKKRYGIQDTNDVVNERGYWADVNDNQSHDSQESKVERPRDA